MSMAQQILSTLSDEGFEDVYINGQILYVLNDWDLDDVKSLVATYYPGFPVDNIELAGSYEGFLG
jgi:cobalamin biosynthesis Co2+ chelatase CbiK